jgi:predicted phosphodiesterase
MLKRIALVSDIHGNIAALEAVTDDIRSRRVDAVFNLGDHVSGPLWPKETLQYLMRQDWINISGDFDQPLTRQSPAEHGLSVGYAYQRLGRDDLAWLSMMPSTNRITSEIFLFHSTPSSGPEYLLETVERGKLHLATQAEIKDRLGAEKASVLICGHSHIPRVVHMPGDQLIINPGSVGLPAFTNDYVEPHVVENGSNHARYAVMEWRDGHWMVDQIAVAYDYRRAAEQARKNNRPDWVSGILTGYITQ